MSYKKETSNSPLRNQLFKNPPSPLKNSLVTTNLCYNLFFSLYFYHRVEFFWGFFYSCLLIMTLPKVWLRVRKEEYFQVS